MSSNHCLVFQAIARWLIRPMSRHVEPVSRPCRGMPFLAHAMGLSIPCCGIHFAHVLACQAKSWHAIARWLVKPMSRRVEPVSRPCRGMAFLAHAMGLSIPCCGMPFSHVVACQAKSWHAIARWLVKPMSRLAFCLCGGLPFAHVLASAPKCSQLLPKCPSALVPVPVHARTHARRCFFS